ncbi:hypothetical protein Tco_0653170 [Tanacetum coccineum]|uniref:Retrovirus-related Pol polyprotein from transposon TNT 1-94-like beta-barrel domain-containing protein n=1 Tax=Tanacetum coccineum TaxID=301880 RepID=A0ABQ4WZM9_9ASTR
MIDSQMDDMIKEKLALKEQVESLEQNLSKQIKEKKCLLQTFTVFKSESKEKEDKYMENEIDLEKKIKELDNIITKFDNMVKIRTTPDACTEGEWGFEHTKAVVQIVLWYLDTGCSKHMTGNRSQLMNFVSKFLGTVRFGNDHIARIMGYGNYQLGNVTNFQEYTTSMALDRTCFLVLCYPTNDNDDLGKLDAKADIGPGLHSMTPTTSSSGLVPNTVSQQPCIPPNRDDWDHLFQPMFDEYFNPPLIVVIPVQDAAAPRAVVLADSPCFEESLTTPIFRDDPLHESLQKDSTSQGSSSNVRQTHTPFENLGKWTKNHPIANVIGDPSRSVSTRKQLQTHAMWCYFDAFLTSVEPKNFK